VQEHTELAWLLSVVTPLGELNRMHQFRDKSAAQRELVSAGPPLLPRLQAADVLAYKANEVPVGEDQREHLELMRDIGGALQQALRRDAGRARAPDPDRRRARARPAGARAQDVDDRRDARAPSTCSTSPTHRKKFKSAQTDSGARSSRRDKPGISN
jgi:tryptophanyl-tRNA synthetase